VTVYLGRPHSSSEVHEDVIAELEAGGHRGALDDLRVAAMHASLALGRGRLGDFGRAMRAHNDATRRLHRPIVSSEADEIGELSDTFGGAGWKVNGAGGQGGTMAILLGPDGEANDAFRSAVAARPHCAVLELAPDVAGLTPDSPWLGRRVGDGPDRERGYKS
jgi:D-glycero-alpha-D-manno-heptose-7-phosphate kinase